LWEDVIAVEKERAPTDARLRTDVLETIAEVEDEGMDGDEDKAECAADKTAVVQEAAAPTTFQHSGEEFYTLTKSRSVEELAKLFGCEPNDYLALLRQYKGWYQAIKGIMCQCRNWLLSCSRRYVRRQYKRQVQEEDDDELRGRDRRRWMWMRRLWRVEVAPPAPESDGHHDCNRPRERLSSMRQRC
jgi:hypothetical protein